MFDLQHDSILPLGSRTPAESAVGIAAELVAARNGMTSAQRKPPPRRAATTAAGAAQAAR